jgi:hypothetical protein
MEIRDVGMIESHGLMTVYVRMRFDCWAVVRMLMMLVVEVRMVMLEPRMGMKVAVPFPNKQQNTGDHYASIPTNSGTFGIMPKIGIDNAAPQNGAVETRRLHAEPRGSGTPSSRT